METDEQKWERRTLLDRELRERFNIAPNWPERIDWETGETYHPGMRYLERLWKRQRAQRGEARWRPCEA